jgi:hypothetical protein
MKDPKKMYAEALSAYQRAANLPTGQRHSQALIACGLALDCAELAIPQDERAEFLRSLNIPTFPNEAEDDIVWVFQEEIKVTLIGYNIAENQSMFLLQRLEDLQNQHAPSAVVIEFANDFSIYVNGMLYDVEDDYEILEQIRTTAAIAPSYPHNGTSWTTNLYTQTQT